MQPIWRIIAGGYGGRILFQFTDLFKPLRRSLFIWLFRSFIIDSWLRLKVLLRCCFGETGKPGWAFGFWFRGYGFELRDFIAFCDLI